MISKIFLAVVIIFVITIVLHMYKDKIGIYKKYIDLAYIVIIISQIFNCFIAPFIDIKTWYYKIDDKKIEYGQGIFTVKRTVLPISRIQQVSMDTNLLLKKLGLVKVNIMTTSNTHYLRNITIDEGEFIIENIINILHKDDIKKKESEVDIDGN